MKSKFQPKKSSPRKVLTASKLEMDSNQREREFGIDHGDAEMMLGDKYFRFLTDSGKWIFDSSNGKTNLKEYKKVLKNTDARQTLDSAFNSTAQSEKLNEELKKENNLLKCKVEVLLDMMTEIYSEYQLKLQKS